MSPISGHVAYAGDGGEVVVAVPRFMIKSRIRPPHIVISSEPSAHKKMPLKASTWKTIALAVACCSEGGSVRTRRSRSGLLSGATLPQARGWWTGWCA